METKPKELKQGDVFILNEIINMSIIGALAHRKIYNSNAKEDSQERKDIKSSISEFLLCKIGKKVITMSEIKEVQVIQWVGKLSDDIYIKHSDKLQPIESNGSGGFSIGVSQKIINLFLKYLWSLGRCKMPPHCPIDEAVLISIGKKGVAWTKCNDIETYKKWIKLIAIKAKEKDSSIAEWELKFWNDKQKKLSELLGKCKEIKMV